MPTPVFSPIRLPGSGMCGWMIFGGLILSGNSGSGQSVQDLGRRSWRFSVLRQNARFSRGENLVSKLDVHSNLENPEK